MVGSIWLFNQPKTLCFVGIYYICIMMFSYLGMEKIKIKKSLPVNKYVGNSYIQNVSGKANEMRDWAAQSTDLNSPWHLNNKLVLGLQVKLHWEYSDTVISTLQNNNKKTTNICIQYGHWIWICILKVFWIPLTKVDWDTSQCLFNWRLIDWIFILSLCGTSMMITVNPSMQYYLHYWLRNAAFKCQVTQGVFWHQWIKQHFYSEIQVSFVLTRTLMVSRTAILYNAKLCHCYWLSITKGLIVTADYYCWACVAWKKLKEHL